MFLFCFLFVGVWLFLCFLFGVFVLVVFSVTRSVSPPLSSHKRCGVLCLSERALDLRLRLMSLCA